MKFSISAEQRHFAASLGELLAAADTPSVVRAWAAGDSGPGRKLWSRLAEQGVLGLNLPAEHGGFGATPIDLVLAFEQLGRAAVPGPLVESVAVLPALLAGTSAAVKLDAIGTGEAVATVAIAPHTPYALDAGSADLVYLVAAGVLSEAVAGTAVESVDPARRLRTVSVGALVGEVQACAVDNAYNLGALCTAAQILGAGQALLERGSEYAVQRRQFGKPIGTFQAVKHLLADAMVAVELARPLLLGAALALGSATADRDVSAAKVACTDAAYLASRNSLQVHGAIGYTQEYDLSLWITRVRALYSAWGTQAEHRRRVLAALTAPGARR
jgi:alkylation response protein AidB-like acyl-CoA dehydrogenase